MRDVDMKEVAEGWKIAVPPPEEDARMEELRRYQILDSWPAPGFDNITSLVCKLLDVPISLVSLVDENRQWFKSACGIDAQETPRDMAFCSHAIWNNEPLVILDTHEDDRFCGNPLVTGEPYIRFYAGAPLITSNGYRLGTLCAIDMNPHAGLSDKDVATLQHLSEVIVDEIELHYSNIQLESLSQTKSNFLATMSHEIRTPMNGIIGMTSMLKKSSLDEKQSKFVDIIDKSAAALLEIINDILDLSKIEAGKMELEYRSLDIVQIAKDCLDVVSTSANDKGIDLSLIYDDTMPCFAMGDAVRIRQVMLNLLSNAVKFTDLGEITVEIRLMPDAKKDKRHYEIRVSDTGIGIPEEKQELIFNKFDQADMSATRKFGGTGLGLAICQNLCHMMHGDIFVKSVFGEGSTFVVRIWLDHDEAHKEVTHPFKKADETYKTIHAAQMAVQTSEAPLLLVEDHPVNCEVFLEMLKDTGQEIVVAHSGKEALELVKNQSFSLIFMDCTMPEMDGMETTRKMREQDNPALKSIPIIALTARAMQGDEDKCLEAGMNDYMSKPITQEQLFSKINKWLHQSVAG